MMIHHTSCPLCKSETTEEFLNCKDFFLTGEVFELHRCNKCGFIFTQDPPDEKTIGGYYESDNYLSHNTTSGGIIGSIYRFSREIMLRKKRNLIVRVTGLSQGSLLDIGSGTGNFISIMKKSGWNVMGIEVNEAARNRSVSDFGLKVTIPSSLPGIGDSTFDCITLWHSLEHFHNLSFYTAEIFRLLRPGGKCVIAIPNCNSSDASHYRQYWAAYDVPRHLWHFRPETLKYLFEKTGLRFSSMMHLPLDVFYISILSEKYKGTSACILKGIIKALWFSILSLFSPEKSSSLVYILEKDQ